MICWNEERLESCVGNDLKSGSSTAVGRCLGDAICPTAAPALLPTRREKFRKKKCVPRIILQNTDYMFPVRSCRATRGDSDHMAHGRTLMVEPHNVTVSTAAAPTWAHPRCRAGT